MLAKARLAFLAGQLMLQPAETGLPALAAAVDPPSCRPMVEIEDLLHAQAGVCMAAYGRVEEAVQALLDKVRAVAAWRPATL